jgi:competence protein ComEC
MSSQRTSRLLAILAASLLVSCAGLSTDDDSSDGRADRKAKIEAQVVRTVTELQQLGQVPAGKFRVHNIDLGTGLSILVQGHDFNLLFDGGTNDDKAKLTGEGAHAKNPNRLLAYLFAALGPSGDAKDGCVDPQDDEATKRAAKPPVINHLVLSHPHEDHNSLLADVLTCYKVENIWDSGALSNTATMKEYAARKTKESGKPHKPKAPLELSVIHAAYLDAVVAAAAKGTQYHTAADLKGKLTYVPLHKDEEKTIAVKNWSPFAEGEKFKLGADATAEVLHVFGGFDENANLNSVVLLLKLGEATVLLAGDEEAGGRPDPKALTAFREEIKKEHTRTKLEAFLNDVDEVEKDLLERHKHQLRVDILQVAHHGSLSSTRRPFLEEVAPTWALIGAGPKAYSGRVLPDPEVIDLLAEVIGKQAPRGTDRSEYARTHILRTDAHDVQGCPVEDHVGRNDPKFAGGCDNYVLHIGEPSPSKGTAPAATDWPTDKDAQNLASLYGGAALLPTFVAGDDD